MMERRVRPGRKDGDAECGSGAAALGSRAQAAAGKRCVQSFASTPGRALRTREGARTEGRVARSVLVGNSAARRPAWLELSAMGARGRERGERGQIMQTVD